MIASRTLGLIFVKPRKAAGTSIEIVLSAWCSRSDICTPVTEEDERLRARYGGRARNYRTWLGRPRFYNHMPAAEIERALPRLFGRAFKFTVERHPYEKVVSLAWFRLGMRGGDAETELGREIDAVIADREYLNFPLYTIDGQVAVDEVWEYGEIAERLETLAERFGQTLPPVLPRAKSRFRLDRTEARQVLSRQQRERIAANARFEFDLMGYPA